MAKFCPECGAATIKKWDGGRDRDACPDCSWVQYTKSYIGAGALVLRDDRILLVERGIPPVGLWSIPSGWMEQDQNIEEAAITEVREETGLEITSKGILTIRNIVTPLQHEFYIVFLCEADPDATPVPDGVESTQARFVHPDEFDTIDLSVFSRWIIESYLEKRPEPIPPIHIEGYRTDAFIFGLL
ncbi:MAG: NUDIX domain-containing protein [Aggregatilineales bacterium]